MTKLYYTPPTEKQFNELKEKAIEVWNTYDNEYGQWVSLKIYFFYSCARRQQERTGYEIYKKDTIQLN